MATLVNDKIDNPEEGENPSSLYPNVNASPGSRARLMFVLGLSPQKIGGVEKFLKFLTISLDARVSRL